MLERLQVYPDRPFGIGQGNTRRVLLPDNLHKLVYWEEAGTIGEAIAREKQLKAGSRQKKINLISASDPSWLDLYDALGSH